VTAVEIALRADQVNYRLGNGVKRLAVDAAAEYGDQLLIELVRYAFVTPRLGLFQAARNTPTLAS
jgi:hypothetical protein